MEKVGQEGLAAAMLSWKGQQAKYEQLFSRSVLESDSFRNERLRQLNMIAVRFGKTVRDDPTLLRLLDIERKGIERSLKIGLLTKWRHRITDYFRAKQVEKQFSQQSQAKELAIKDALFRSGFSRYTELVMDRMRFSKPFSIHHTEQLDAHRRIDYRLSFTTTPAGDLTYSGYHARYVDKQGRQEREQFYPNELLDITPAPVAAVLLSGRALVDPRSVSREREYIQYDFSDKDAEGNFRMIRFDAEKYEREAARNIRQLPVKTTMDQEAIDTLLLRIGEGKAVQIALVSGGEEVMASIYANPRGWDILLLNQDGRVLDPYRQQNRTTQRTRIKDQQQIREKTQNKKSLAQ